MKFENKKLSLLLVGLYLLGMIVSAFILFSLKNKLIYELNVLSITDAQNADAAFYQVYIFIGLTMILGLIAIYFLYKGEDANIIYVEKTKEEERRKAEEDDEKFRMEDKIKPAEFAAFTKDKKIEGDDLEKILSWICKKSGASQGAIYIKEQIEGKRVVRLHASFAMSIAESEEVMFEFGEGLVGQVAKEHQTLYLEEVPEGFVEIISGLGSSSPSYLLLIPIITNEQLNGVVEIASFEAFKPNDIITLENFFISGSLSSEDKGEGKEVSDESSILSSIEVEKPKKVAKKKKTEDK